MNYLIAPLLSFYMNIFGIKWPGNIDMPLNKETKVLDKNTWDLIALSKLFILDRNSWYHMTVRIKLLNNNIIKNININIQWTHFPNL